MPPKTRSEAREDIERRADGLCEAFPSSSRAAVLAALAASGGDESEAVGLLLALEDDDKKTSGSPPQSSPPSRIAPGAPVAGGAAAALAGANTGKRFEMGGVSVVRPTQTPRVSISLAEPPVYTPPSVPERPLITMARNELSSAIVERCDEAVNVAQSLLAITSTPDSLKPQLAKIEKDALDLSGRAGHGRLRLMVAGGQGSGKTALTKWLLGGMGWLDSALPEGVGATTSTCVRITLAPDGQALASGEDHRGQPLTLHQLWRHLKEGTPESRISAGRTLTLLVPRGQSPLLDREIDVFDIPGLDGDHVSSSTRESVWSMAPQMEVALLVVRTSSGFVERGDELLARAAELPKALTLVVLNAWDDSADLSQPERIAFLSKMKSRMREKQLDPSGLFRAIATHSARQRAAGDIGRDVEGDMVALRSLIMVLSDEGLLRAKLGTASCGLTSVATGLNELCERCVSQAQENLKRAEAEETALVDSASAASHVIVSARWDVERVIGELETALNQQDDALAKLVRESAASSLDRPSVEAAWKRYGADGGPAMAAWTVGRHREHMSAVLHAYSASVTLEMTRACESLREIVKSSAGPLPPPPTPVLPAFVADSLSGVSEAPFWNETTGAMVLGAGAATTAYIASRGSLRIALVVALASTAVGVVKSALRDPISDFVDGYVSQVSLHPGSIVLPIANVNVASARRYADRLLSSYDSDRNHAAATLMRFRRELSELKREGSLAGGLADRARALLQDSRTLEQDVARRVEACERASAPSDSEWLNGHLSAAMERWKDGS